jgi:hypothetical protein
MRYVARKRTKKSAAGAAVEGSDGEFGTPATKKRAADG